MRVKATRFFISSAYGNVDEGQILVMPDAKARQLIAAGLVKEFASPVVDGRASSFQSPVEAERPGSLSQVDQASQQKIASASDSGAGQVTYRKRKKSRS